SKNDDRSSSDSVSRHQEDSTSDAGTSGRASPERWKDEDLGWFPNPKGEYSEFSNSILLKFYLSCWTTCPYKERFRRCFVTERKRQSRNAPLPTRRPYSDFIKLLHFHYLSWSETATDDREPGDFQPRTQIKRLFKGSILVSGDSEVITEYSDK
ncbi:unnamed protein product, partial [Porites lobata]